jgi:hypothetical protein
MSETRSDVVSVDATLSTPFSPRPGAWVAVPWDTGWRLSLPERQYYGETRLLVNVTRDGSGYPVEVAARQGEVGALKAFDAVSATTVEADGTYELVLSVVSQQRPGRQSCTQVRVANATATVVGALRVETIPGAP